MSRPTVLTDTEAPVPTLHAVDERSGTASAFKELIQRPVRTASELQPQPQPGMVVIGQIASILDGGMPAVYWPVGTGTGEPMQAQSLVPITADDVAREVALVRTHASAMPLILGFVWQPADQRAPVQAVVDGEEVQIEARQTLTLRCGQASITLTADGQVLLRGTYVSSHSSGTQRIKGAAVRIN